MSFLNFKIISEGTQQVHERLDLYDQAAIDAAKYAMVENTEALLGKAMRIVPHDKGMLEGSGSARVNEVEVAHGNDDGSMSQNGMPPGAVPGSTIVGTVSFNTPYAARQHEELSYRHKEGRQAKYLESPLKEFISRFAQNIANAIKGVK